MQHIGQAAQAHEPKFCQALLDHYVQAQELIAQPSYARTTRSVIQRFLFTQHIAYPHEVTTDAVERYLMALKADGRQASTLINHKSFLSGFFSFLQRRGLIGQNPCVRVRLKKPEEKLPHYLDVRELKQTLQLARRLGLWPEVCLAVATGLRLSELIRLRWDDVNFAKRTLAVRKSKSRRPRIVFLTRAALTALRVQRRISKPFDYVFPARQTWTNGGKYLNKPRAMNWWVRAPQSIKDSVATFQKLKPGTTGRFWHTLRHTFASRLAQADVSLYKIGKWLGHHDPRVTQMYAHLQDRFDPQIEAADGRVEAAAKFAERAPGVTDILGRPAEPLPAPELTKAERAKLRPAEARRIRLALSGKTFKEIADAERTTAFAIRRSIYRAETKVRALVNKLKLAGFRKAGYWWKPGQYQSRTKKCPVCREEFYPTGGRHIYCSKRCFWKAQHARTRVPVPRTTKKCRVCGRDFLAVRSTQTYCSSLCYERVSRARLKLRDQAGTTRRWTMRVNTQGDSDEQCTDQHNSGKTRRAGDRRTLHKGGNGDSRR